MTQRISATITPPEPDACHQRAFTSTFSSRNRKGRRFMEHHPATPATAPKRCVRGAAQGVFSLLIAYLYAITKAVAAMPAAVRATMRVVDMEQSFLLVG